MYVSEQTDLLFSSQVSFVDLRVYLDLLARVFLNLYFTLRVIDLFVNIERKNCFVIIVIWDDDADIFLFKVFMYKFLDKLFDSVAFLLPVVQLLSLMLIVFIVASKFVKG